MNKPRPEYPRPQFKRSMWENLNGQWSFSFDFGVSGEEQGYHKEPDFDEKILMPFCPESKLSGIGYTDFIPSVWYHRAFELPDGWVGNRILLHFGAVDYDCTVWINGMLVGRHLGGASSFHFDITDALQDGENHLTIRALDDTRSHIQPAGKQSTKLHHTEHDTLEQQGYGRQCGLNLFHLLV